MLRSFDVYSNGFEGLDIKKTEISFLKNGIYTKLIEPILNKMNENIDMDFNFNDDPDKNYVYIELNNPKLMHELIDLLEHYKTYYNIGYHIDLIRYCK